MNGTNVVYEFTCQLLNNSVKPSCIIEKYNYIGMTSTILRLILIQHKYNESFFQHYKKRYLMKLDIDQLLANTKIID